MVFVSPVVRFRQCSLCPACVPESTRVPLVANEERQPVPPVAESKKAEPETRGGSAEGSGRGDEGGNEEAGVEGEDAEEDATNEGEWNARGGVESERSAVDADSAV